MFRFLASQGSCSEAAVFSSVLASGCERMQGINSHCATNYDDHTVKLAFIPKNLVEKGHSPDIEGQEQALD